MQDVECPIKGLRLLAESPYPTLLWRFDPVGCARSLFLIPILFDFDTRNGR